MLGLPELRAAIAHRHRRFQGLALDRLSAVAMPARAS
jgi:hypothetical protein